MTLRNLFVSSKNLILFACFHNMLFSASSHCRDLLNGGTRFEFDTNGDDPDMFDGGDDDDIEEIDEEEIEKSPWQSDFDSLRKQMVPLSNFLYKKVIKPGNVEIPPNARVVVDYNAYFEHEEQSYDSTYMRGKPVRIRLGYGEVLDGLEQAVKTMKKGEESHFVISHNILYGERGCPPRIKPKADVLFLIRCKDFSELSEAVDETNETNFTVIHKRAIIYDGDAKSAFRKGNYMNAIWKYKKASEQVQFANLKDEAEEKLQTELLKKFFLNLAVCYNKVDKPKKACTMINNLKDLGSIQNNSKALYQEGKALSSIGNYERAHKSFRRAAQLQPDDEMIAQEIRQLEEKIQKFKDEEKRMCQTAFGTISNSIAKVVNEKGKEADPATTELFKTRIQEFMDGEGSSLSLPGPLDPDVVKCIKNLETVFNFKLEINDTSSSTYYKLKKL